MTLSDRLRAMVDTMPTGASVSLPVEWLRAQLAQEEEGTTSVGVPDGDLTLEEMAVRVHRAPSTVRGWLNAEVVPGAYKLRGRDWRIPPAALQAFLNREAEGKAQSNDNRTRARAADLGAWRQLKRKAGAR